MLQRMLSQYDIYTTATKLDLFLMSHAKPKWVTDVNGRSEMAEKLSEENTELSFWFFV